jgi:hypothetical protein
MNSAWRRLFWLQHEIVVHSLASYARCVCIAYGNNSVSYACLPNHTELTKVSSTRLARIVGLRVELRDYDVRHIIWILQALVHNLSLDRP